MRILLIILMFVMLAAVGYYTYVGMTLPGEPLPEGGYLTLLLGAVFAVICGAGLMALLFISSRRGYDEPPHFK